MSKIPIQIRQNRTGAVGYTADNAVTTPPIQAGIANFLNGYGAMRQQPQPSAMDQKAYSESQETSRLLRGMYADRKEHLDQMDFQDRGGDLNNPIWAINSYTDVTGAGQLLGTRKPHSRTIDGRVRELEMQLLSLKAGHRSLEEERKELENNDSGKDVAAQKARLLQDLEALTKKIEQTEETLDSWQASKGFMNFYVRAAETNVNHMLFRLGPPNEMDKLAHATVIDQGSTICLVNGVRSVHGHGMATGYSKKLPLKNEDIIAAAHITMQRGWNFMTVDGTEEYMYKTRAILEKNGITVRGMRNPRDHQPKGYDFNLNDFGVGDLKTAIHQYAQENKDKIRNNPEEQAKIVQEIMKNVGKNLKAIKDNLEPMPGNDGYREPNYQGFMKQLERWAKWEAKYAVWTQTDAKDGLDATYNNMKAQFGPKSGGDGPTTSYSAPPDRFYPEQVQDQVFEKIEQRADALLDIADLSGSEKANRRQDIASEINDERRSLNDEAQKVQANIADLSQSQADLQSGVIGEFQEIVDIYERLQQAYGDNLPKIASSDKTGLLAEILGLGSESPAVTLEDLHSMDLGRLFNSEHKQAVLDEARGICVEAAQDYLADRSALRIATQQHAEKERQLEAVKAIALGLLSDLREAREGLAEANNMANDARDNLARLSEEQPQFEQRIQDLETYSEGLGRKIDTLNATIAQAEENPTSLAAAILPELHAERLALTQEQGATDRQADALQQERAETIQQYENQLNEAVHARIPFLEARLQGWDARDGLIQNEGLESKVQAIQEQVVTVHTEVSAAKQKLEQAKNRLGSSKEEFKDTMANRKAAKLYVDMAETITAVAEKLTPEFFTQLQAATIQHEDVSARLDEQSSRLEAIGSRDAELVEKLAAIQVVDNIGSEYRPLVNARGEAEEIRLPQSFIDQRSQFTEILGDAHGWWMADTINKDISRLLDKTTAFGEQVREHLSNDEHVLAAGHRVVTDEAQIGHLGVFADSYNRLVMEYEQRFDNLQNGTPHAQEALTKFIRAHGSRIAEMENTLNLQAGGANLFAVALSFTKGIPSSVDEWQDAASYNPPAARLIEINTVLEKVINESPDLDVVRTAYLTRNKMHDNARNAYDVLNFDGVLGGIPPEKLEQALTDPRHGAANAIKLLDHIEAFVDRDFDASAELLKQKAEPKFSYEKTQSAIPVLGRKPSAARGATMH